MSALSARPSAASATAGAFNVCDCIGGVSPLLSDGDWLMEALLPPTAAPAAIPPPDPENTRESDGGALMFDSCEFDMAVIVMAIRNFRTQRQETTADNLSVGFVATCLNNSVALSWDTGNEDHQEYLCVPPFAPFSLALCSPQMHWFGNQCK